MRLETWQQNLLALTFVQFFTVLGFNFVFPFMPLYVRVLGVQDPGEIVMWAGILTASANLTMAMVQPIWGAIADRHGRRLMVMRSVVGNALIIPLMAFARTPEELLALRIIQGSVTGAVAASNALVSASTPKNRMGFALGILQVAYFLGGSTGPFLGGFTSDTFGFHAAFLITGAVIVIPLPIVFFFVRETAPPVASGPQRSILAESRSLLTISVLPVLIGVIFLIQLCGQIVVPMLSLFVAELGDGTNAATEAGEIMALTGVVSAFAAFTIGRIGDRLGHVRMLLCCLLGAALLQFPQSYVSEIWQLLVLRMVLGFFLGGLMPSANALIAGLIAPARRGAAFGLATTANSLGFVTGPLLGAAVSMQWGLRSVFFVTGLLFALNLAWVLFGYWRFKAPFITKAALATSGNGPDSE